LRSDAEENVLPKKDEVIGEQRKIHMGILVIYTAKEIMNLINSRNTRSAGQAGCKS
jgi:hypothetical protein